jgi:hypothetical protein
LSPRVDHQAASERESPRNDVLAAAVVSARGMHAQERLRDLVFGQRVRAMLPVQHRA